jgi:hypothetical protein
MEERSNDESVTTRTPSGGPLASTPDFLDLAGTIEVPATKRDAEWSDVIWEARAAMAARLVE